MEIALVEEEEDRSECSCFKYCLYRLKTIMYARLIAAGIAGVLFLLYYGFSAIGKSLTAHPDAGFQLPYDTCGAVVNNVDISNLTDYQAALSDAPWTALLQIRLSDGRTIFSCTGALISAKYVITAAHCIAGVNIPSDAYIQQVRLGEYNLETNPDCMEGECSPPPQDIEVVERLVHPSYDPSSPEPHYDIGLLRLAKNAVMSQYVSPICFPKDDENYEGKNLLFSGWGIIHKNEHQKKEKMKIFLPVIPFNQCDSLYKSEKMGFNLNEYYQMCVGGSEGRNVYCHWGTGGATAILKYVAGKMRWHIAGVSSYGPPNCGEVQDSQPDIYTKFGPHKVWIVGNMRE